MRNCTKLLLFINSLIYNVFTIVDVSASTEAFSYVEVMFYSLLGHLLW